MSLLMMLNNYLLQCTQLAWHALYVIYLLSSVRWAIWKWSMNMINGQLMLDFLFVRQSGKWKEFWYSQAFKSDCPYKNQIKKNLTENDGWEIVHMITVHDYMCKCPNIIYLICVSASWFHLIEVVTTVENIRTTEWTQLNRNKKMICNIFSAFGSRKLFHKLTQICSAGAALIRLWFLCIHLPLLTMYKTNESLIHNTSMNSLHWNHKASFKSAQFIAYVLGDDFHSLQISQSCSLTAIGCYE